MSRRAIVNYCIVAVRREIFPLSRSHHNCCSEYITALIIETPELLLPLHHRHRSIDAPSSLPIVAGCGMETPSIATSDRRQSVAGRRSRFLLPISSRQIDESNISIADFFPPNRGDDFYCRFLTAKLLTIF